MAAEPARAPHADLNFVLAVIKDEDALRRRAMKCISSAASRPIVTFAVGIELLLWCRKYDAPPMDLVALMMAEFSVENGDVLATAAHAMQKEGLRSPLDAVHLAVAHQMGSTLLTADERLWKTKYPTERF